MDNSVQTCPLVSKEQAFKLKTMGYTRSSGFMYGAYSDRAGHCTLWGTAQLSYDQCWAPTLDEALYFLRQRYGLHVYVMPTTHIHYMASLHKPGTIAKAGFPQLYNADQTDRDISEILDEVLNQFAGNG